MGSVGRDHDNDNADHIPTERDVFEDESSPQERGLCHRNLQIRFRRETRDHLRNLLFSQTATSAGRARRNCSLMISLTPSCPAMRSQMGPCVGSKSNAKRKKGQHALSFPKQQLSRSNLP